MNALRRSLFIALALLTGCATPTLRLVESAPVETTLNHADIPDAKDVWPKLIADAKSTLDIAEFYVSNKEGSALEPVIQAIEAAADRGVHVRLLAEEKFTKIYPETLERLAKRKNIEVRHYNVGPLMGGILHAKYFVVDGATESGVAYVGSQNMDWRSLEHIQELGVEIRQKDILQSIRDVYETDWALAGGAEKTARVLTAHPSYPVTVQAQGEPTLVTPVFSPKGFLPDESLWDLPRMVQLIEGAQKSVRVQVLTYKSSSKEGPFPELEEALVRAANRGVKVELLVSHWSLRKSTLPGLQQLATRSPNLTIRVLTIPKWSGGEIDFARVVHAKYMAVDGAKAWVGTSNWERDYFYASRNLGVILEGHAIASRLERFFDDGWTSSYTTALSMPAAAPAAAPATKVPASSSGAGSSAAMR